MKKTIVKPKRILAGYIVSTLISVSMLVACAAPPKPPTEAIQSAEQAINAADSARVADYASIELTEAREKLTAARLAVNREQMVLAQRLAEESRVDAELASAKAEAAKANAINTDMQKSNDTLNQEMQRHPGVQP